MNTFKTNRRDFFKTSALGIAGSMSLPGLLSGCSNSNSASQPDAFKDVVIPELFEKAIDGRPLKAGLVGCGGRGKGAAQDFLNAGDGLQITALADVFPEPVATFRETLKAKGNEVPEQNCFVGFDAYKKLIDSGVDYVILATPPLFRPEHFEYAVSKGRNCFIEKPCAVCPTGVRQVRAASKIATAQGLTVNVGTQLRSSKDVVETYRRVVGGMIGEITSAHVSRMGDALWFRPRQAGWSDMEYLLRNWTSFCRTSGDFVVEMFVHEIDLMTWFLGNKLPIRAEATGGRARRLTGDMYDHFSMTFVYADGMRANCTSRQISGCPQQIMVNIYGTKGHADPRGGKIYNKDGTLAWQFERPKKDDPEANKIATATVQTHIQSVNAIRSGKPFNKADQLANSTLIAIMGREAAYTGKFITWEEIMASNLKLTLDNYEFGPIPDFKEEAPLPGTVPPPPKG